MRSRDRDSCLFGYQEPLVNVGRRRLCPDVHGVTGVSTDRPGAERGIESCIAFGM